MSTVDQLLLGIAFVAACIGCYSLGRLHESSKHRYHWEQGLQKGIELTKQRYKERMNTMFGKAVVERFEGDFRG